MKLIAQRPCNFGGRRFFVGDEIPIELVVNPKAQSKLGVLTIYNDGGAIPRDGSPGVHVEEGEAIVPLRPIEGQIEVAIPIATESGIQALSAAPESIIEAIRIMQMDVKAAEKAIEGVEDENALIILNACDSRKGIKSATEKRAMQITEDNQRESAAEDAEESAGDA